MVLPPEGRRSTMSQPFTPNSDEDEAQAITRLVDGSAGDAERESLEQWASERPDVQRRIAQQRRVVSDLGTGGPDVPGPLVERVLARVDESYGGGSVRGPARRGRPMAGWRVAIPVAAVAALALVLVVVFAGGGSSGPSVNSAAQLAYEPATSPAPAAQSARLLDVSYGGVTFPNYEREFRAVPTGQLRNRIGGRPALTVFYRLSNGARLSYTVFSGKPVPPPASRVVPYDGVALRVYKTGKLAVVTLVRHGRTCVLAAPTGQDIVLGLAQAPLRAQAA
jgi:hypothetical protein